MASYGPPGDAEPGGPGAGSGGSGGPGPGSGGPAGQQPGQEPWRDQGQYGDPADPWGSQPGDPWGGQQTAWAGQQPWQGQQARGGQQAWEGQQARGDQQASIPPGQAPMSPPYGPSYGSPTSPAYGYEPPAADHGYGQVPPEYAWQYQQPPPRNNRNIVLAIGLVVLLVLLGAGAAAGYVLTRDTTPQTQPSTPPASPAPSAPATSGQAGQPPGSVPATGSDARFVTAGQCVVNDGTNDKPVMRIVPCAAGAYQVLKRFDGTTDFKKSCPTVAGYQYHFYYDSSLDVLDFVLCMKKL